MNMPRSSGILLHPTSLPSPHGIGDFGPYAHEFVAQLEAAGQKIWQLLPLGPTGKSFSPYKCLSSFAGNPLLISPQLLVDQGYLSAKEIVKPPRFSVAHVEFERVETYKSKLLRRAFAGFSSTPEFEDFHNRNAGWLQPFAQFMALKSVNHGRRWTKFSRKLKPPDSEIKFQKFIQFEFFRQWIKLKDACNAAGISILGDIPFYVEHDSADVWARPQFFDLDTKGEAKTVGGVPPDYFSATGQLWGNPTYCWRQIEKDGFQLWINRLRSTLNFVDLVRLDHFRGFVACWKVPARERTAKRGYWAKVPGARLFNAARKTLGELPIVAENLGLITPAVEALRRQSGFPGMAVLQFAFGEKNSSHLPSNYEENCVAFTGTHDNDTILGWWRNLGPRSEAAQRVREFLHLDSSPGEQKQAGKTSQNSTRFGGKASQRNSRGEGDENDLHWRFIAAVFTSAAQVAIVPIQDVLGLGSEARMNVPGLPDGNWRWRLQAGAFDTFTTARLRELTNSSGRGSAENVSGDVVPVSIRQPEPSHATALTAEAH